MILHLTDCSHCTCKTRLKDYTIAQAIAELGMGQLGCWNCLEYQDCDDPDNHFRCVALKDAEGNVLWDGRHPDTNVWKRETS